MAVATDKHCSARLCAALQLLPQLLPQPKPETMQAEDERGQPVTQGDLSPTDLLSVAAALTFATWDATANHGNFTLNNMIACLIATGERAGLCAACSTVDC